MRRYRFFLILFIVMTLSFSMCKSDINSLDLSYRGRIISYIRTWEIKKVNGKNIFWSAEDIDGETITDLNIAFAIIKNGSDIDIESLHWKNGFFNLFSEISKLKEKYPSLRINLSIGGWGADGFSDMANNKKLREEFVNNVIEWVEKYGFNGVDIDWEYPVDGGGGIIKSRSEDRQNFTYLMKEIKQALNTLSEKTKKNYQLSFAAAAFSEYLNWIEPSKIAKIVDYVNLMNYDFYGDWSDTTGHHSNLFKSDFSKDNISGNKAVKAFINAGFSSNQIVFGIPFFGKGWQGVDSKNNGLYQKFKSSFTYKELGYEDIKELIDLKNFSQYWDESAKEPFLYNGDIWISYDDLKSIKYKTDYIKKYALGGIMIWEYSFDMKGELLILINKNLRKKSIGAVK